MIYRLPFSTLKDKTFNASRLASEIKAALGLPSAFIFRSYDDKRDLSIDTGRELADLEQIQLKSVVEAHVPDEKHLATAKAQKFAVVDRRTKRIIDQGFVYNGVRHSLSENMQKNLLGAMQVKDVAATFPIKFNSIDDLTDTIITDAASLEVMFATAMMAIRVAWEGGTALKAQVRAATTVEEVNAISDTRS